MLEGYGSIQVDLERIVALTKKERQRVLLSGAQLPLTGLPVMPRLGVKTTRGADTHFGPPAIHTGVLAVPAVPSRIGKMRPSLVALLIAFTVAACGDGATEPVTPPVTPEPANRAPEVVGTIPSLTLTTGDTESVDVSSYFRDPDGDALSHAARTSDPEVATASISGSTVTVTRVAAGEATITVTATDPGGLSATQSFEVTVPNRAPEAVGGLGLVMLPGHTESVDMSSYFSDPDGDMLSYEVETSDADVATASVSGSTVTVTGVAAGEATITVTATDPDGLSATQSFEVTVQGRVPERTLTAGDTESVDMSSYFIDPDGDVIYTAGTSDAEVATASVSGSTVTITGVAAGEATITVTATDPDGLSATQIFEATVLNRVPEGPAYPIHVHYVGTVHEDTRRGMESAAAKWARILAPTPAASFTFGERSVGYPCSFSPEFSQIVFRGGDTLEPGLHLYVAEADLGDAWASAAQCISTESIGLIRMNRRRIHATLISYRILEAIHDTALHEIAHVLGIGFGKRWEEWEEQIRRPHPDPLRASTLRKYFTDPKAIAVFDRMGGTDFPATTPKIPIDASGGHWDGCTGLVDTMVTLGGYGTLEGEGTITELTLASLGEGYIYDPALIPDRDIRLDPTVWNRDFSEFSCRDGELGLEFLRARSGAASPKMDGGSFGFEEGVIYEFPLR